MIARRGFTLIELLITAIVMAILGTMLARMLVSDSRFVGRIEAMMAARQTARAAVTMMSNNLRMVSPGNLRTASSTHVSYNLPIAWGMACQRSGANVIATLLPTDSLTVASHGVGGVSWTDATGTLQTANGTATIIAGPRTECTSDSIRTLAGGQYIQFNPNPALGVGDLPSGTIFHTFEIAAFEFKNSVALPGRTGLWMVLEATGTNEEILWPFDPGSRFEFVTEPNGLPALLPPGVLSTVNAIEIVVLGESEVTPRDATDPEEFELRTRITFVN